MKSICVIPAYNCEKSLPELIAQASKYVDCVLVVDDGSDDRTAAVARRKCDVIRLSKNQGKGVALLSGVRKAIAWGYSIIVTIDGDGENDPNDIPQLISQLLANDVGVVLGCRTRTHSSAIFGYKLTKVFLEKFLGIVIDDAMCGLRVYRSNAIASILPKIRSRGYGIDLEIVLLIVLNRISFVEVPVSGSCLIPHDGIKATHVYDFLCNLKNYAPSFNGEQMINLPHLLHAVQQLDDFDICLGDKVKRFRFNPQSGLYQ